MMQANLLPWREARTIQQRSQLAWLMFGLCVCLLCEALLFRAYEMHMRHSWEAQYQRQWTSQVRESERLAALMHAQQKQRVLRGAVQAAELSVLRFRLFLALLSRLEQSLPIPMRIQQIVLFQKRVRLDLVMLGESKLGPLLKELSGLPYIQEPRVRLLKEPAKAGHRHHAHINMPLGV